MTSGKKARQQRRTPAPPPVRSTGGGRTASPKVLGIAAAVIGLVAIAIILAVVLSNGSSKSKTTTGSSLPDASSVQQLLDGIPQHGSTLGNPNAPATMIQYIDLQCPFCRQFELDVMPTVLRKYVRTGKLAIDTRPVAVIGSDSQLGRQAALAAAKQNRMSNFNQLLYLNQGTENTGWLNDSMVASAYASIPGFDAQTAQSDRSSGAIKTQEQQIDTQAAQAGLRGTPWVLIGKTGGHPTVVQNDLASVEAAIKSATGQ
jgi:protein-disulfide isomerase